MFKRKTKRDVMEKKKKTSKPKKPSVQRKPKKVPTLSKKQLVRVPTNASPKLVDENIVKRRNYMTNTGSTFTEIYALKQNGHVPNQFEIAKRPRRYSTRLLLVLNIQQTNELSWNWSTRLWNITQSHVLNELGDDVDITFVKMFERRDNQAMQKTIQSRRRLSILSSDKPENIQKKSIMIQHDVNLYRSIETGNSVLGFGAEAFITATTEQKLERAVQLLQDYIKTDDELKGLSYELDINKQDKPLLLYGPNAHTGNKDVFIDMTSHDASIASLFVDSGGDRTPGSEYVGYSVGKHIAAHSAYNFQNSRSMYIGNDTRLGTPTMNKSKKIDDYSQIYLSKIASRSYLLSGKQVVHIVADDYKHVEQLMNFPLFDKNKQVADVAKGLLNIIEPMKTKDVRQLPAERMVSRYATHVTNLIVLLSQFRDKRELSVTDEFATVVRQVFTDFMVARKHWAYDANKDVSKVRLFVQHDQFPKLYDFGLYVTQRLRASQYDSHKERKGIEELDTIINQTILPTIPSLNTITHPVIDDMMTVPYKVVDLTGTGEGQMSTVNNPSMNIMAIAYLNALLPSLKNGDVVFFHGISRMSQIAGTLIDIIHSSGLNLDIVFTEKNQTAAMKTLGLDMGINSLDFYVVDLYQNQIGLLEEPLGMSIVKNQQLVESEGSFFIKNRYGIDYIYLDAIF